MKIYTKTGDKGKTSLFDGTRVVKSSRRIESYGLVDEVNSQIGVLISLLNDGPEMIDLKKLLLTLQDQLFILGSDLANPADKVSGHPRITLDDISFLENHIDQLDESLEPLKSFILPGGSIQASQSHVIRTVIRRAEVSMVDLYLENQISEYAFIYINRLSDLFFVLARTFNKRIGQDDTPWNKKTINYNNL